MLMKEHNSTIRMFVLLTDLQQLHIVCLFLNGIASACMILLNQQECLE